MKIQALWKLQQHYNSLDNINKNIEELNKDDSKKKSYLSLRNMVESLTELENKIKDREKQLKKDNLDFKDYDYQLKNIEKKLYQDNLKDLKQLKLLDTEMRSAKEKSEEKELEILTQMEELDSLKNQFANLKDNYNNKRRDCSKKLKENKLKIEEMNKNAEKQKNIIEKISLEIDDKALEKFLSIKKKQGNVVAEVVDNRCNVCNVFLANIIIERLNADNEVVHCESCNRILYLEKENK